MEVGPDAPQCLWQTWENASRVAGAGGCREEIRMQIGQGVVCARECFLIRTLDLISGHYRSIQCTTQSDYKCLLTKTCSKQ